MAYQGKLSGGQIIVLENGGDQTTIHLRSAGQSQSNSFSTGKWNGQPSVFQVDGGAVVQIETEDDLVFYSAKGGQLQSLLRKPDLENARAIDLEEVEDGCGKSEMKPMKPMKPM